MYLGKTIYRIHGTNQPQTIGHAVSSGCFRLVDDDIIDLYDRVPVGTKVIIKQAVDALIAAERDNSEAGVMRMMKPLARRRGGAGVRGRRRGRRPDAEDRAGPRQAGLRREPGHRRLLDQGRQGRMVRLRRRLLPRARRGDLQRSHRRSTTCRSTPPSASTRSRTRRSTSCRATRPGRWAARRNSNVVFAGVTYYDGQAFIDARRARNATSALDLDGSKVCVQKGTTSEPNAKDFFDTNHVNYEIVEGETVADIVSELSAGKCNVLTTDESQLFALRSQFPKPGEHMILPDVISKEPLGPVVRQDDMQWFNIVKWVNFALLDAEEMGVSSKTIDEALKSQKPAVKRLVGTEGEFGKPLGLPTPGRSTRCARSATTARSSTATSARTRKLGIPRGLNELWDNGGIQYAPPIR